MIEYHKFGYRDSNRGRIKCHGPELEKPHGITHACIKTFLPIFFLLSLLFFFLAYSSLGGVLFSSVSACVNGMCSDCRLQGLTVYLHALFFAFWELFLQTKTYGTNMHVDPDTYMRFSHTPVHQTYAHPHIQCVQ